MTIPEAFVTTLVVALFAVLVAGFLALFQYRITKTVESDRWKREQRVKEIERIDAAAAEVTKHAAEINAKVGTEDPAAYKRTQGNLRASFARWDMLSNPYCRAEEREEIKELWGLLLGETSAPVKLLIPTVIKITHAVKERCINEYEHPWWQIWK